MKCVRSVIFILVLILTVNAAEVKLNAELQELHAQIDLLKTLHLTDVTGLKNEIAELKKAIYPNQNTQERNEQLTLQWAKTSMNELRIEMRELTDSVNNSALLRQLHVIRNELKQALMETTDLAQLARTQEARLDKLDSEVGRLKYEAQQSRTISAELRTSVGKLAKELKAKLVTDMSYGGYNDVIDSQESDEHSTKHGHKIRHNKMVHTQISRLAHTQEQLDEYQQSLQTQILDVQRRLDRFEEPNWNLLSAKVDFLDLETSSLRNQIMNVSQLLSDFDRVHASMLELREDIESIEDKADKTIPEFRMEISKLDISFAQLNAQSSYLKENQENIRQTIKAVAVSISNAVDRAEIDRDELKKINHSVIELKTQSKQHYYRLNDHILKTEANKPDMNNTQLIPLPELIGEVKELQPVQREYEVLVNQLPRDCSSISGPPGSYLIHPGGSPLDTWCVNGNTVLQRRFNGSIEFNRKFIDYVHGFGDTHSEYWIGLEAMHELTSDNCSSMQIDMTDIYGGVWYAQYEHFTVGNADSGFVLDVSGFKGNASDAFEYQNHMEFSAIDLDRDISNTHCAGNYEGGWWFSHCQHVNINGKYTLGLTWFDSVKNEWIAVATSEMRMYRRPGCF